MVRLLSIELIIKYAKFDMHFIQCRTSTDISGIVNEFAHNMSRTISNLYTYPFNLQLVRKT